MRIFGRARAQVATTRFTKSLLFATAVSVATVASAAYAQTPAAPISAAAPASNAIGEVVVTGSRIRGVAPVGSAVTSVNRQDIALSGAATTTDLLQKLPQVFNYGITSASRQQSGGSNNVTYGSSINIHGIGPFATLTLVDGHRVVPQGTTGFAVDPSVIPTIGLERVEVIADGASALYGSDAIAGVANLILRRNFEGLEVSARYGTANNYDEHQFGVIAGHRWSSGQFTVAYENVHQDALSGFSRNFENNLTAFQGGKNLTTQCAPGTITAAGTTYAIPAGGVTAANRSALVAGTSNKCDNLLYQDILPRQDHDSLDFTLNQTVNDRISLFADGIYAKRTFYRNNVAATANLTVPSSNPYFVAPPGSTVTSETVAYSFANDFINPPSTGFSENYSVTAGADVKLPYNWKFEGDFMYGRNVDVNQQYGTVNAAALTTALNSSNPAVAFNPFGGGGNSLAVTAPFRIGLVYQPGEVNLQTFEAKFDGPLFHVPGGEVRAAVGYEGQRLQVVQGQDSGTLLARVPAVQAHRYRQVDSIYGELLVPLVSPDNGIPGIHRLDIDIAGRQDRYSDVGSTTNPKYGVNWSPITDVVVHGSYGTSFRAPTISQIYGNSSGLFVQNYADPALGGAPRVGVALSGGNLNLHPETAKTYSVGADYTPAVLPGAKFSLTWFDVQYDNQVANYLADLTLLSKEGLFTGTPIITRNPSAAQVASLLATYPVLAGVVPNPLTLFVDGRNYNLGQSVTKGIDFDFNYRRLTDRYGAFTVGLNGTYLTDYKSAITATAPLLNFLNVIQNPVRFRSRGTLGWNGGGFNSVLYVNYTNAYTNNLAAPVQTVLAYTTVDLHLIYDFKDTLPSRWLHNIKVGLDVNNLFDAAPPFVNVAATANAPGGFDANLTNPIGRLVAISIDKKW